MPAARDRRTNFARRLRIRHPSPGSRNRSDSRRFEVEQHAWFGVTDTPMARARAFEQCIAAYPDDRGTRELAQPPRSEEHTSELQSRLHLVCRLLLEKKTPRARQGG